MQAYLNGKSMFLANFHNIALKYHDVHFYVIDIIDIVEKTFLLLFSCLPYS